MEKLATLKEIIGRYHSAIIAFSGGVDSTFLTKVAGSVLGEKLLLVTAYSSTYPEHERTEATQLARQMGIAQRVIESEETDIAEFVDNPPDRCYYCKRELFRKIRQIASDEGYEVVFDGSNIDDALHDYRPGRRALRELGIVSPLEEAQLTKEEIRVLSRELGLVTATKPSYACLASRFPYGEKITVENLQRVGRAEIALHNLGFLQVRVRMHGTCARVEVPASQLDEAWSKRDSITAACRTAGFTFVALDTLGYRMGAMNEDLK